MQPTKGEDMIIAPSISTVAEAGATLRMIAKMSCMALLLPMILWKL